MGIELAKAFITIRATANQLGGDLRNIAGQFESQMSSIAGNMGSMLSGLGIGFGIYQLVGAFSQATEKAHEFEKSVAKLEIMMGIGGKTVGFSTETLELWISKISAVSTVSAASLREASTHLLMFQKLQGDMFHRTLRAATDLSLVFGSVESASRILGRAMDNPSRGAMMLRRAGVSLSEEQMKQIKTYMKQHELLKAQEVLMGVVEAKVKGLAAAYALSDPGKEEMKVKQLEKLSIAMGTMWMPVKIALIDFKIKVYATLIEIGKYVGNIVAAVSAWVNRHKELVYWGSRFIVVLISIIAAASALQVAIKALLMTTVLMKAVLGGPAGWAALAGGIIAGALACKALNSALDGVEKKAAASGEALKEAANNAKELGKANKVLELDKVPLTNAVGMFENGKAAPQEGVYGITDVLFNQKANSRSALGAIGGGFDANPSASVNSTNAKKLLDQLQEAQDKLRNFTIGKNLTDDQTAAIGHLQMAYNKLHGAVNGIRYGVQGWGKDIKADQEAVRRFEVELRKAIGVAKEQMSIEPPLEALPEEKAAMEWKEPRVGFGDWGKKIQDMLLKGGGEEGDTKMHGIGIDIKKQVQEGALETVAAISRLKAGTYVA